MYERQMILEISWNLCYHLWQYLQFYHSRRPEEHAQVSLQADWIGCHLDKVHRL